MYQNIVLLWQYSTERFSDVRYYFYEILLDLINYLKLNSLITTYNLVLFQRICNIPIKLEIFHFQVGQEVRSGSDLASKPETCQQFRTRDMNVDDPSPTTQEGFCIIIVCHWPPH